MADVLLTADQARAAAKEINNLRKRNADLHAKLKNIHETYAIDLNVAGAEIAKLRVELAKWKEYGRDDGF